MRRSLVLVAAFVFGLALPFLMAQVGGFPSRPRFQSVGINAIAPVGTGGLDAQRIGVGIAAPAGAGQIDAAGTITARGNVALLAVSSSNPTLELRMNDASADNQRWQLGPQTETFVMSALNDAGSQVSRFLEVQRTGATIDSVNLLGTAVRANGVAIARITISPSAPSGAGMLVGDVITISKTADTSRASDATLAVDPHLQVTALPAGQYALEAYLQFAAGAGGSSWRIDAPVAAFLHGVNRCTSNGNFFVSITAATSCVGANPFRAQGVGATDAAMTTGTISVFWAQQASDVAATTLEAESWLRVTRLK